MLTKKQVEELKKLYIEKPHIGIIYKDLIETLEEAVDVIKLLDDAYSETVIKRFLEKYEERVAKQGGLKET